MKEKESPIKHIIHVIRADELIKIALSSKGVFKRLILDSTDSKLFRELSISSATNAE